MTEKMQMNRRELLMLSAAGAALSASAHAFGDTRGAGAASGLLGNAPTGRQSKKNEVDFQNDELILYFQMPGAWDVCLAWDPKDRNSVTPGGLKVTDQPYEFGQLKRTAGMILGPAASPLLPFANRMTVVNGIDMGIDNGHTLDVFLAGSADARSAFLPFFQAKIASSHPKIKRKLIPHTYLSYDGGFFSGPLSQSTLVTVPQDFASLAGAHEGMQSLATLSRLLSIETASALNAGKFASATADAVLLSQAIAGKPLPTRVDDPEQLGGFLATLALAGVLGSATVSLDEMFNFDTHSQHYQDHPLERANAFIAGVLGKLSQVSVGPAMSLLDRTTVVLFSEFARTPLLNSDSGKDHNISTNSLVLFGGNFARGMFGASGVRSERETHAALPVDLATGVAKESGELLQPEGVLSALAQGFGVKLGAKSKVPTFLSKGV